MVKKLPEMLKGASQSRPGACQGSDNNAREYVPPIERLVRDYDVPQNLANRLIGTTEQETAENINMIIAWAKYVVENIKSRITGSDYEKKEKARIKSLKALRRSVTHEQKKITVTVSRNPCNQNAFQIKCNEPVMVPTAREMLPAQHNDWILIDPVTRDFSIVRPEIFERDYKIIKKRKANNGTEK